MVFPDDYPEAKVHLMMLFPDSFWAETRMVTVPSNPGRDRPYCRVIRIVVQPKVVVLLCCSEM